MVTKGRDARDSFDGERTTPSARRGPLLCKEGSLKSGENKLAIIRPFRALRPAADKAEQVASVPYDVVYESEVRSEVGRNPLSFLRVTRPEGDYPEGAIPDSGTIYQ